jgi:hypothetical protein
MNIILNRQDAKNAKYYLYKKVFLATWRLGGLIQFS